MGVRILFVSNTTKKGRGPPTQDTDNATQQRVELEYDREVSAATPPQTVEEHGFWIRALRSVLMKFA